MKNKPKKPHECPAVEEAEQVHSLLDGLGVPLVVSPGAAYERDKAHDRIMWLTHQGMKQHLVERIMEKNQIAERDLYHLAKLAKVYEAEHAGDEALQTHPWAAVRWVKERLK